MTMYTLHEEQRQKREKEIKQSNLEHDSIILCSPNITYVLFNLIQT